MGRGAVLPEHPVNITGGIPPAVQARKKELLLEARVTLDAIRSLAGANVSDPFLDPTTLVRAVTSGILDAPHLRNSRFARGEIVVRIDDRGACVAVEPSSGRPIPEKERIARLDV